MNQIEEAMKDKVEGAKESALEVQALERLFSDRLGPCRTAIREEIQRLVETQEKSRRRLTALLTTIPGLSIVFSAILLRACGPGSGELTWPEVVIFVTLAVLGAVILLGSLSIVCGARRDDL